MHIVAAPPLYPGTREPNSRVGSWLATHELLAHLVSRGHQVDVFPRLAGSRTYVLDGVNVGRGKSVDVLKEAVRSADVVLSHLGDDAVCAALAIKYRKPNVRMVHSPPADPLEKLAGTDLAVFNSHSLSDEIGWAGPQIVVHPPLRRIDAQPGGRVTLVNLSEPKGGELFWRLARALPDIEFLAVRGYSRQILERYPNVHVIATQENMERVYSRTRILLMPSERESWGMVGVEAMSCGIPVIAHPTPGLQESLGPAGLFVDRDDAQGWLDQIGRLQDYGQWEDASHRARVRVGQIDFATDRFADAIESLVKVPA